MRIVRTSRPMTPDIGDIDVYGLNGWLKRFDRQRIDGAKMVVSLDFASLNPWRALDALDTDAEELRQRSLYECPITDRVYSAWVPDHIISSEIRTELLEGINPRFRSMAIDVSWMKNVTMSHFYKGELGLPDTFGMQRTRPEHVTRLVSCLIGPGHTTYLSPSDGHASVEVAALEFDNGDELVCYHLVWYNK